MKTALMLMSLGAAFVFTMGSGQAGWRHFESASNHVSALSTVKDNKERNKHEKKQGKKQQKKRDNENAGSPEPDPAAPNNACANSNVLIGDYCQQQ
jgi:hypothetical protein